MAICNAFGLVISPHPGSHVPTLGEVAYGLRYANNMSRDDPMPALRHAAAALAETGQPSALFAALQDAMQQAIGHRLFTVMRHDAAAGRNRRAHTSDASAYPVSGFKPVNWDHPWTRRVLVGGTAWIGSGPADIAWAYPDHETIVAMGLGSAMNLPVRWNGRTLGTVNLLHDAGHFTEADAAIGMVFAALAVPALLGPNAA
jgi:GAF domain-containing protein